jgi:hypothetical protein
MCPTDLPMLDPVPVGQQSASGSDKAALGRYLFARAAVWALRARDATAEQPRSGPVRQPPP